MTERKPLSKKTTIVRAAALAAVVELSRRQEAAVECARDGRVLTAQTYRDMARVSKRTAIRDLNDLVDRGWLLREGRGSAVSYRLAPGKQAPPGQRNRTEPLASPS